MLIMSTLLSLLCSLPTPTQANFKLDSLLPSIYFAFQVGFAACMKLSKLHC